MKNKEIWTIGHSTRSFEEFVAMLHSFHIELVVDVRSYPGSRRYPHFNKEILVKSLPENGIEYLHMLGLGGRRKTLPDSKTWGGGILHFAAMPIIWKPKNLKLPPKNWKSWQKLNERLICVPKPFGGVATAP